jgi:hypothetical protein
MSVTIVPILSPSIVNDFRLTLATATPVTNSNVYGATTLYCTPFSGNNRISLYNGAEWVQVPSAEFSIALGTLSNLPYDVFCNINASGLPVLSILAWSTISARATALALQNGILCKSGDTTFRYLGTFHNPGARSATATMTIAAPCVVTWTNHGLLPNAPISFTTTGALPTGLLPSTTYYVASAQGAAMTTSTFNLSLTPGGALITTTGSQSGTHTATVLTYTEDSENNRLLYNEYNVASRKMVAPVQTANWTYDTAVFQIWNNNLCMRLFFMTGTTNRYCSFRAVTARNNSTTNIDNLTAIGFNSVTLAASDGITRGLSKLGATQWASVASHYEPLPAEGLNYVAPLHRSSTTATCTWIVDGQSVIGFVPQ